jgi:Lon-like protease
MTTPIVPTGEAGPDAADGEVPAEPRRLRRTRRSRWIVALVVAAIATAAMFRVELPYYLLQPGSVRSTDSRIDIEGATVFDDDGEILFTTVLLSRATPALMVRSFLDDAIDVRSEEEVYPDGDVDGARRANVVRMDISKLVATRVALDYLGVDAELGAEGARVLGLVEGSPSEGVLQPGDVIIAVDGAEIGMPGDIAGELEDRSPGDRVPVVVVRRGEGGKPAETRLDIDLGEARGEGGTRPVLGVEVEPNNLVVESDVNVALDSGEVSGPSAGLAWALGIVDRLTPGSLTGGRRVATTGELYDDGSVNPVGGILQKLSAVKRSGIGLFLYPSGIDETLQREMRRLAGDEVELRPVSSLDEAVRVLAPAGLKLPE